MISNNIHRNAIGATLVCCALTLALQGCDTAHLSRSWVDRHRTTPRTGMVSVDGGSVWYEIVGDGPGWPLLVVHGGPGAPHDYLNNLVALGGDRPIVFYDQLGCGKSDRPGDTSLWTRQRSVRELADVRRTLDLRDCFILGQSWGTVITVDYLLTRPKGVHGVILANEALSVPRTAAYMQKLIDALPGKAAETIRRSEREGTTESAEYKAAVDLFYKRHMCRLDPWPEDLNRTFEGLGTGVYNYMNGPSEFTINGTIKDVDVTDRLSEIKTPTLFITGEFDEVPPYGAGEDAARMQNATAIVIHGAAHMSNLDRPEEYMRIIGRWLREQNSRVAHSANQ